MRKIKGAPYFIEQGMPFCLCAATLGLVGGGIPQKSHKNKIPLLGEGARGWGGKLDCCANRQMPDLF
jgi:hypothetical protein